MSKHVSLTDEAYSRLLKAQKGKETFSVTILRLIEEYGETHQKINPRKNKPQI